MSDSERFDWLTLSDDETVTWSGHPRKISVVKVALVVVVVAAGVAFVDAVYGVLAAVLGAALVAWVYLWIVNVDYVVTNRAVYRKRGVLGIGIARVDLGKVQNTHLSKGVLGTRFGFGTVAVDTAGSKGIEISINDIYGAEDVQELLVEHTKQTAGVGMNATRVGGAAGRAGVERALEEARDLRRAAESLERTFTGGDA